MNGVNAGIVTPASKREFSKQKTPNGVDIFVAKENRAHSDFHISLYKISKNNTLSIVCFPNDQFEDALKKLEAFHYKDAKALVDGDISLEDYAAKMGFQVKAEKVKSPKAKVVEGFTSDEV